MGFLLLLSKMPGGSFDRGRFVVPGVAGSNPVSHPFRSPGPWPADRPVPPLEDREKVAEPAICKTPQEWKGRFEEMKKVRGSGFSIVEEIEDPSKKSGIKKVGKL